MHLRFTSFEATPGEAGAKPYQVDEVIKWSAANFPSAAGAKPDQVS